MLWYKGWLETRFLALFMFLYAVFPIVLFTLVARPSPTQDIQAFVGFFALYYSMIPVLLAGSGIKTQSNRATKGLHGSVYFTLSLPVSRFQLFATRVGLGMLETAVVLAVTPCAVWAIFSPFRVHITHSDLFAYWVTISVCAVGLYSIGVLLSTVLNDLYRGWASMFGVVFLYWFLRTARLPKAANIFQAMGESSPLFTHSLPWSSMGVSLGAAAVLLLIANRVVESLEY